MSMSGTEGVRDRQRRRLTDENDATSERMAGKTNDWKQASL